MISIWHCQGHARSSLGSGGTLTVQLSEGVHTITAAVTDSDNASNSTQITFTVTPTAIPALVQPGSSDSRRLGARFIEFAYRGP